MRLPSEPLLDVKVHHRRPHNHLPLAVTVPKVGFRWQVEVRCATQRNRCGPCRRSCCRSTHSGVGGWRWLYGDDDTEDELVRWTRRLTMMVVCWRVDGGSNRVFYKMVAVVGGRYFSIEHEKYEFQTGVMLDQRLPSASDSLEVQDRCFFQCESVFVSEELCRRQTFPKSAPLRGMYWIGRKFTCVSHICQSCTSFFVLILLKFVVVMICVNETFVHRGWGKNNTRRVSAGHFAFCGASLQPLHWLG